jgi:hypothetical protein
VNGHWGRTLSSVLSRTSFHTALRNPVFWIVCVLVAALAIKFLYPLFLFDQALGYDVGFYRYLFIRHAEGFPPFFTVDLEPWARGHPLGLFFFSTILIRLGVPVDWLIGWVWNVFSIVLLCTLAWATGKRYGRMVGVWTLVAALLSVSTFDAFGAMYWKTFASLFWMILALRAVERRSWLAIPFGLFTVVTHHQTGLLFGLVMISYYVLPFLPFVRPTFPLRIQGLRLHDVLIVLGAGIFVVVLGLLAYIPIWKDAILPHLPALLGETDAASGSFPPALYYLQTEAVVLFFGVIGFVLNVRRERWTPWQLSVLWSFLFVALHLLFYRRFFIQLEFFLLPFVGVALSSAWSRWNDVRVRVALVVLLVVQLLVMRQAIARHYPMLDDATFDAVFKGQQIVPSDAFVLGLENVTPVILRAWFPHQPVGGPGLFDAPWGKEQWETILLGNSKKRAAILRSIPGPLYLFASGYFRSYYGEYADVLLRDPCLQQVDDTMYYLFICGQERPR